MNKQECIKAVADRAGVTQQCAESVIDAFTNTVGEALAGRDDVKLVGFGTFSTRQRAARDGRNPMTGEAIKIPAAVVPDFSASALLKAAVAAKAAPKKTKRR